MPIRIDYSPVGTLMNLARSAGKAQGARESATHDLAFTQMAMQAQTQNAQIASTIRRNDQAFQLQRAALARQARTPTRAAPGVSPVAQEFDEVLERATVARGWKQKDIAAQMQQLNIIPGLTDRQRESARLKLMAGQSLGQVLQEAKPELEQVGLTRAQQESRTRILHQQQRDDLEAERKSIYDELGYEGKTRTPEWQARLDAVTKKIQIHDAQYAAGMVPSGETTETPGGLNLNIPQPWPAKADAKIGQLYVAPNNEVVRWNGILMVPIKKK